MNWLAWPEPPDRFARTAAGWRKPASNAAKICCTRAATWWFDLWSGAGLRSAARASALPSISRTVFRCRQFRSRSYQKTVNGPIIEVETCSRENLVSSRNKSTPKGMSHRDRKGSVKFELVALKKSPKSIPYGRIKFPGWSSRKVVVSRLGVTNFLSNPTASWEKTP